MSAVTFPFPAPPEMTVVSFFLLTVVGFVTRVFTKNLDEDIQKTDYFKSRSKVMKLVIKKTLDLFHHWPLGWFLMIYSVPILNRLPFNPLQFTAGDIYWIGAAIFIDDLPEVPRRVQDALKNYSIFGQLTDTTPEKPIEEPEQHEPA